MKKNHTACLMSLFYPQNIPVCCWRRHWPAVGSAPAVVSAWEPAAPGALETVLLWILMNTNMMIISTKHKYFHQSIIHHDGVDPPKPLICYESAHALAINIWPGIYCTSEMHVNVYNVSLCKSFSALNNNTAQFIYKKHHAGDGLFNFKIRINSWDLKQQESNSYLNFYKLSLTTRTNTTLFTLCEYAFRIWWISPHTFFIKAEMEPFNLISISIW